MSRELPALIAEQVLGDEAKAREKSYKLSKDRRENELISCLKSRCIDILKEYVNLADTRGHDCGLSFVFKTYPAFFKINGLSVPFIIGAVVSSYGDAIPKSLPKNFNPPSVFITERHHTDVPLYEVGSTDGLENKFINPANVENVEEKFGVVSGLLDAIEQDLSENHIPLSKQPKKSEPKGLKRIFGFHGARG